MAKRFELTDSFTGQSFGYIAHVSTLILARKMAQKKANEVGYEVSLHEVARYGERILIEKYQPKD